MLKITYLFLLLSIGFFHSEGQLVSDVNFTISGKGFIFTTVHINGIKAKAMIDFGDPHVLQVSTTFIDKHDFIMEQTDDKTYDVFGNTFEISEGTAETLVVTDIERKNITFQSGKDELEHVSKEIGKNFEAVLGWGFFKEYKVKVDYGKKKISLYESLPKVPPYFSTATYAKEGHLILNTVIDTVKAKLVLDTGASFNILDSTWYNQTKAQITAYQSKKRYKVIFNLKLENINTSLGDGRPNLAYLIYDLPEIHQIACVGILGKPFFAEHTVYFDPEESVIYYAKRE